MRLFFAVGCLMLGAFSSPLVAKTDMVEEYLEFLDTYRHLGVEGNYKRGEIEIVKEPKKIHEIEDLQKSRYLKKGMTPEQAEKSSRVGIIAEDFYWIWIRDAVFFPTGAEGTFDRLLMKGSLTEDGYPGVSILPVLPDGRVVLILNYRHATRSWELEVPRGGREFNEEIEVAAKRELEEETGLHVSKVEYLGDMTPESGTLISVVPMYIGRVNKKGLSSQDFSEAILRIEPFTVDELKEGLAKGYVEIEIKGKKEKVALRDSFLTYSLLLAEYKKLL